MIDLELAKLKVDALHKFEKFKIVLHKSMEENLRINPSDYDFKKDTEFLEKNSLEGIEYKKALEKLKHYTETKLN